MNHNKLSGTCDASAMAGSGSVRMRARYSAADLGVDSTYYITDVTLPGALMTSATYYDAVPAHLSVSCPVAHITPKGLEAATTLRVLGDFRRSRVSTVNFYDSRERVVYTSSNTADNSSIRTTTEYDFAGNPVKVSDLLYIGFNRLTDVYTYTYDRLNRLSKVTLSHNGAPALTITENTYDNLGRVATSGPEGKARTTFSYDMRSALSGISSWHFHQTLSRGAGKYTSRSGRITRNEISVTGRRLVSDYLYDGVGRLVKAETTLTSHGNRNFSEEFAYDRNTNITSLRRYGGINGLENDIVDDLTLTYSGNRLKYVTDDAEDFSYSASLDFRAKEPLIHITPGASVGRSFDALGIIDVPRDSIVIGPANPPNSSDYSYDANGNMTVDRHSSISSISYNLLNLPYQVTYEGLALDRPQSRIIYDAAGRKHAMLNGRISRGVFTSDVMLYVGGYVVINDSIDRLNTPYGYLRDGEFHSFVRDYQGNVMCVVSGDEVDQTNIYYPDGLPMTISTEPTANPLKYTGKELSLFRGLPVYDFTARHTLPALGNPFRTPDPKAWDYTPFSPYTFCAGDPINYTDPTGEELEYIEKVKDLGICDEIVNIVNDFLEGTYIYSIDDKGKASLIENPNSIITPNKYQQAFIDTFSEIIGSEGTTTLNVDINSGSPIGSIETATSNVADIEKLGDGPVVSAIGAIYHETTEQYLIQVKGLNPGSAHLKASMKETGVTGFRINYNKREIKSGTMIIEGTKVIDENGKSVKPRLGVAFMLLDDDNKIVNSFQMLSE